MLHDLTRLAGDKNSRPRFIRDVTLEGEKLGVMIKGSTEIRVPPSVYDLIVTPDGTVTSDFESVARTFKVKVIKKRSR